MRNLYRLHTIPRVICVTPRMMDIFIFTLLTKVSSVLVPCQAGSIPNTYGVLRSTARGQAHLPCSTHISCTRSGVVTHVPFVASPYLTLSCSAQVSKSHSHCVFPNKERGIEKHSL